MSTMVITPAAPVRTTPVQAAPIQSAPAQAAPAQGSPAQASPSRNARRVATSSHGQLRLTRRGRIVIVAGTLLAVLALGFVFAGSVASRFSGAPTPTTVVKVEPGQTLWGIAAELTPSGDDVRDTMYEIQRLNAFESASLSAGQRIRVPAAN